MSTENDLGQPIGEAVPGWTPRKWPPREPMFGEHCTLEPLDVDRHAADLWEAQALDTEGRNYTYLPTGPFETFAAYVTWMRSACLGEDPQFFAILNLPSQHAVGTASYMRIQVDSGVIEVGYLNFSPLLQRTIAATEAMYLMMRRAFDELGYRRYEWKCDSLNAPSRAAAERLGFTFEGVFRQAVVVKGRNRDTAWYSVTDREWPRLRTAFEQWLDPANFCENGRQKRSLTLVRESLSFD